MSKTIGPDGIEYDITPPQPKNAYFIGRCHWKGCQTPPIRITVRMIANTRLKANQMSTYPFTVWGYYVSTEWIPESGRMWSTHSLGIHCVRHRYQFGWKPINGIYSEKHVCDARCVSAKGPNCECSCGGANHGAAYDPAFNEKQFQFTK